MYSIQLNPDSETHKRIAENLRTRYRESAKALNNRLKKWREAEELFVGYISAGDEEERRKNRRDDSGTPDYTTIHLPYSYAVAMSAHSYLTSVFLARSPVYQFMGSTGEGEQQVLAVEALLNYQMYKARMLANHYIWLQDTPKYGEGWLFNYWRTDYSNVAEIVEVPDMYNGIELGTSSRKKRIRQMRTYSGNAVMNIHPADVFTDPRYPRNRFQEGEFVGLRTTLSKMTMKVGEKLGQFINVDRLKKTTSTAPEYTNQKSDAPELEQPKVENLSSSLHKIDTDVFEMLEFYITLIPRDWKIGSGDMPEKWCFTITADFSTIVEARPMGNMHDKYPLALTEIEPEGYMLFSRSLVEIFGPVQQTVDWLVNSHFYNVRQVLNNQFIFDPSKVYESDVASRKPGKAMRLKPAAYGTDVRTALSQIPAQDITGSHLNDLQMMYAMGERLGVSDSIMGVQTPSSRRTAQEIRGSQAFAVGRLKTIAEYFSCTGFTDLASMMVSNSQQYYDGEMKLKIAGEAATLAGPQFLNVTPEDIVGEYLFAPVDGTLPIDRYAQASLWRELITQMAQVPQVIARYDMGKIFGYVAQLSGIKNLTKFEVQVGPDAMIAAQAQQGNMIPAVPANPLEPGQIAGMGSTA